jgi:hypothetical protein
LAIAIEKCNPLRETNAAFSAHNALLQSQTKQVQQFNAVGSRFPVLFHHVTSLMQSTNQQIHCYNSKMKRFYIITASMGETMYQLFDCLFGFPSWRQVERYRSRRRNALGLQQDAFCLSRENFHALAQGCMSSGSDTRVCRCVDGLSHNAHVLVYPDIGEVTGLTEPLVLDRETANF